MNVHIKIQKSGDRKKFKTIHVPSSSLSFSMPVGSSIHLLSFPKCTQIHHQQDTIRVLLDLHIRVKVWQEERLMDMLFGGIALSTHQFASFPLMDSENKRKQLVTLHK